MKVKRRIIAIIVIVLMVSVGIYWVYGKGMQSRNRSNKEEESGKLKIGFLVDNLVIERWQTDQEIFQTTATELGAQAIVYNANENNETQNEQMRRLIELNVDVIVVIAHDKDGLNASVKKAREAGIPIVAYDRLINNANVDAYISFDNVKVGELIGEGMAKKVPIGNYVIINGNPNDHNSSMFNEGYMSVLGPKIQAGQIKIVGEGWAQDWREDHAYNLVSDVLQEGKQIDAIIGANDRLSEAAINALASRGLAGTVVVAGHDADISACQRIVEGTQYMTIYKPIRNLAEQAVHLSIDLARNKGVESEETIYDGSYDVPYIKLDVVSVYKENMKQTVIEDGFHHEEDVYRKSHEEE